MPSDVPAIAARAAEALIARGFELRETRIGDMGSIRALTRGALVVFVNDDRGRLGVVLGLRPAPGMSDASPVSFWAHCLGLRGPVPDEVSDLAHAPTLEECVREAEAELAEMERVVDRLAGLPHEELRRVDACAWARLEARWRAMGFLRFKRTPPA